MRSESSAKTSLSPRKSSQSTLLNFLRPRAVKETVVAGSSTPLPCASETAKVASYSLVSSDDEDEEDLASPEHLFGTPKLTKSYREAAQTSHNDLSTSRRIKRPISPPLAAPSYSSTFNLQALLNDRVRRNEQKATIDRLNTIDVDIQGEHTISSKDSARARLLPERVGILLAQDSISNVELSWSSVRTLPKDIDTCIQLPDCMPDSLIHSQMPTGLDRVHELDIDVFCDWIITRDMATASSCGQALKRLFLLAKAPLTISNIAHALLQGQFEFSLLLECLEHIMNLPRDQSGISESDSLYLVEHKKPAIDVVVDAKLTSILRVISARFAKQETTSNESMQPNRLLRLIILLHLDSVYGSRLYSEIAQLLRQIYDSLGSMTLTKALGALSFIKKTDVQIQVLQCLPVHNSESIQEAQAVAIMYFLAIDGSKQESLDLDHTLPMILKVIRTASPFHPLNDHTPYDEMKRKLTLLSWATMAIPPKYSTLTTELITSLQSLHGRIVDSKAAFIVRSEAKAAIQRLSDRLKYTLEGQKRKHNVFDHLG